MFSAYLRVELLEAAGECQFRLAYTLMRERMRLTAGLNVDVFTTSAMAARLAKNKIDFIIVAIRREKLTTRLLMRRCQN